MGNVWNCEAVTVWHVKHHWYLWYSIFFNHVHVCWRQNGHPKYKVAKLIDVSDDLRVWFLARWKFETNFSRDPFPYPCTFPRANWPWGSRPENYWSRRSERERGGGWPGAEYVHQWMRVISRQAIRVDEVMTRNSRDGQLLSKRPLARPTKPILQQSLGIPPISFHIHISTTALCDF